MNPTHSMSELLLFRDAQGDCTGYFPGVTGMVARNTAILGVPGAIYF